MNAVAVATKELSDSPGNCRAGRGLSAADGRSDRQHRRRAREGLHLEKATKNISSIVDLIDSIAAQTKLLALNATIEPPAPEKRALCCLEVKSLAQQTENATLDVSQHTVSVQTQPDLRSRPSPKSLKISEINGSVGCLCRR